MITRGPLKIKKKEIIAKVECVGCLEKCLKKYGRNIQHLHIKNTTTKIIESLHMTNQYCENLVCLKIDLSSSPLIFTISEFETNFCRLFQNNKKIESLIFESFGSINTNYLRYLSPKITKLYLWERLHSMNVQNFTSAFERFSNLREFNYMTPIMKSTVVEKIASSRTLIKLSLNAMSYEDPNSINYLKNLVGLKSLNLHLNPQLEDSHIITIVNNCKKIEYLNIWGCDNITDLGIANISKLKQLKYLNIINLCKVTGREILCLLRSLQPLRIHVNTNILE
ncbi:hypothetical protein PV326_006219 [Microctonus aethiopoides]|nr:hypothetical protein PV326_006219 [Microctonus aethiopoides]